MPRKPPPGKSLAEVNPELAKEWHPSKNGDLTPFDVTAGSNKKVWWKCDQGDDHEWCANPYTRNKGSNCPVCKGQKVVRSNCLAIINPELAKEWHPSKNGELTPFDFTLGSGQIVWWRCHIDFNHVWKASINSRNRGSGCCFCSGNKVNKSNSLANLRPDLVNEWHPTKNRNLNPKDYSTGSGKKVWWKCPKADDHEWQVSISNRNNGSLCPFCSGHKVAKSTSLGNLNSALAQEWHPTKNGDLTPYDVAPGSNKKVWWKCDKGDDHEWVVSINNRSNGGNCPICLGQKVVNSNCLATLNPELAKEWHPTKNGDLTPYGVTAGSNKKVWWKCNKGDDHEWKVTVNNRTSGMGCPICSNRIAVLSNCLATSDSYLAKEWHPTKNDVLTPYDVTAGSNKKVWWKCNKGADHEWKTSIIHRANGNGCPFCTLTPQSRQELTITFELLTIFKGIDPKGFKTRINGKIWSIDIYIPKIHIGIEFDGSYWHKDKSQLDKVKTEKIEKTGLNLIRVRQKPLDRLFEDDVMAEEKFNGKQITNDILKQIVKDNGKYAYTLDKRTLNNIDKYINKEGLQNEKGLDKYIDQILTEKAERKKVK